MFPYEKWDIYKKLMELKQIMAELNKQRPKGMAKEFDNVTRAIASGISNLAEGAGYTTPGKKINSYENGAGSIHEAATGLLTIGHAIGFNRRINRGRVLCDDVCAMFTNLIKSVQRRADEQDKQDRERRASARADAHSDPADPDPASDTDPETPIPPL